MDGYLCPVISRTLRTKYHKLSAIRTGNYHHSFYSSGDWNLMSRSCCGDNQVLCLSQGFDSVLVTYDVPLVVHMSLYCLLPFSRDILSLCTSLSKYFFFKSYPYCRKLRPTSPKEDNLESSWHYQRTWLCLPNERDNQGMFPEGPTTGTARGPDSA